MYIHEIGRMDALPKGAAATAPIARGAASRGMNRCPGRKGANGFANYDVALTYAQLDARSDAIAAGLQRVGIVRGTRTVLMVRPSHER